MCLTWMRTTIRLDGVTQALRRRRRASTLPSSRSNAARSSRCSGRPAAARRRSSARSRGSSGRTPATIELGGDAVAGRGAWVPPEAPSRRHGVPGLRALPAPDRGRERRLRPPARRARRRVPALLAHRRSRAVSAAGIRTSSPVGSSSASPWRVPWRPSPAVVLLDEPWSNVDPQLRAELREEVSSVLRPLGVTRCSSRTTARRRSLWPTALRSCAPGGSSRWGRPRSCTSRRGPAGPPSSSAPATCSPGDGRARPPHADRRLPGERPQGPVVEVLVRPELVSLEPDPDGAGRGRRTRVPRARRLLPRPARGARARLAAARRTRSSRSGPGSRSASTRDRSRSLH